MCVWRVWDVCACGVCACGVCVYFCVPCQYAYESKMKVPLCETVRSFYSAWRSCYYGLGNCHTSPNYVTPNWLRVRPIDTYEKSLQLPRHNNINIYCWAMRFRKQLFRSSPPLTCMLSLTYLVHTHTTYLHPRHPLLLMYVHWTSNKFSQTSHVTHGAHISYTLTRYTPNTLTYHAGVSLWRHVYDLCITCMSVTWVDIIFEYECDILVNCVVCDMYECARHFFEWVTCCCVCVCVARVCLSL